MHEKEKAKDWLSYFEERAISQEKDHEKAGWGSETSMLSRFEAFLKLFQRSKEKTLLLDVGCGPGNLEEIVSQKYGDLKIIGLDFSIEMLRNAQKKKIRRFFLVRGDAENLPFSDEVFPALVCIGVLQNCANGEDIVGELRRVTKKRGQLIIETLNREYEGFEKGERKPNPINKYFSPYELRRIMQRLGLKAKIVGLSTTTGKMTETRKAHVIFVDATRVR